MNEIMMNQLSLNAQLLQQTTDSGNRIAETVKQQPTDTQPHYAVKGDENYDEAMDIDGDGTITYDEYMEYCKKNAVSTNTEAKTIVQRDSDTVRTLNVGKAFETYARADFTGLTQSMISGTA